MTPSRSNTFFFMLSLLQGVSACAAAKHVTRVTANVVLAASVVMTVNV